MGAEIISTTEHTGGTAGGTGGNSGTATTSAKGTGLRTGAGTGAGTGTGTKAEEKPTQSLHGLSDLEKENALKERDKAGTISQAEKLELRRLRKNRLKREKYQQEKEDREKAGITQGEPIKIITSSEEPEPLKSIPKPKKAKATRTKATKTVFEAEQIDSILVAVFDLIASRPNMGAWKITKQEAHTVSVPLCEVLEKYDQLSAFTQNSAEIALIVACISLFVPRLIATAKIKKEVSQDGLHGKSIAGSTGRKLDETRPSKASSGPVNKPVTTPRENDDFINSAFGLPL